MVSGKSTLPNTANNLTDKLQFSGEERLCQNSVSAG